MIYLFKTYMLVAAVVFGLSGVFILALVATLKAKEYTRALLPRIAIVGRERSANSRTRSRIHNADSIRVA